MSIHLPERRYLKYCPREFSINPNGELNVVYLATPQPYDRALICSPEAQEVFIMHASAWLGTVSPEEVRQRLAAGESVIVTPRLWITHWLKRGD